MPLEFALRPRIRLTDGFAPPRRSRFRLPKLALPVVMYWLTAGGITYALIHWHDQPDSAPAQSVAMAAQNPEPAWWQPSIAPAALPTTPTTPTAPTAAATSEPAPALAPALPAAADPTPTAPEPALAADEPELVVDTPSAPRRAERTENEPRAALLPARPRHRRSRLADDSPASSGSLGAGDAISALPLPPLELPSPAPDAPAPAPTPDAPSIARSLPSCEAAAASANQAIDLAHPDHSPDLSRDAIAAVLDNGVWIARCDIPMSTSIQLCVAIQGGAVIGASVSSQPANAAINACLKRRAAGLHFPYSSRVDVAKTRF